MNTVKSVDTGGGGGEVLIELLRSLQLLGKKREGGLYWPGPQQLPVHTPQITMEIYISDWIHKFQNKTGLDAKANSELYKSKRVCSAPMTHATRVRSPAEAILMFVSS
jgi:hypothetical protein